MSDRSDRSDRFTWGPGQAVVTQCALCLHRPPAPSRGCPAFPARIPDEIIANRADHREPWPGQPGDPATHFGPRPGVPRGALDSLYRHLDSL